MTILLQNITDRFNAYASALFMPKARMVTASFENARLEQIHDAKGELQCENTIISTRWYEARKKNNDYKIIECTRISPKNGLLIIEPYTEKPVQLRSGKTSFDGFEATQILRDLEYKITKTQGWLKAKKQRLSPLSYNRKGLEF